MRNTFKVLFYIKKNAPLRNGNTPIMGRITINGQRTQLSTQLSVNPNLWDVSMGRAAGRSAVASRVNEQLSQIRFHIERCYNTLLVTKHAPVTPKMVKEMYFGNDQRNETLLAFFRHHNEEFSRMVGISRSKTTYYKYRCVYKHLRKLRQRQIQPQRIAVQRTRQEFLTGFHHYIAQECGHKKNTTWIYMIAFKHILMLARSRGHMTKDPLRELQPGQRIRRAKLLLSMTEIRKLIRLDLDDTTLQLVRDAFLFSCFTGLSYIDLCTLTPQHIQQDGKQPWISTTRRKNRSVVNVRIRDTVHHSAEIQTDAAECADIPPAEQRLVQHLPRTYHVPGGHSPAHHVPFGPAHLRHDDHVCAGMAIETISKLLGHKNIRITQIYATITHSKLDGDMERLPETLSIRCITIPDPEKVRGAPLRIDLRIRRSSRS